ncbi:MAG: type transport system ATP-binding protein [Clostridiales bacterium]|nr:type transport system ATP-binding protein [Clostridiales bacterium]
MYVELTGIKKYHKAIGRILDISASFRPGITAIAGPNGAGKTTLLRIMAGIDVPDAGHYLIDGDSLYIHMPAADTVAGIDPMQRMRLALICGYVPQSNIMPLSMRVKDAMKYLASLRGEDAIERVKPLLHQWCLDEVSNRPLNSLSPGQRRRFLIAQSLLVDPELLLLDEPTAGLDPKERQVLLSAIASRGGTIIMATHILDDAAAVAQRLVIMKEGRIAWQGGMDELEHDDTSALERAYAQILQAYSDKGHAHHDPVPMRKPR